METEMAMVGLNGPPMKHELSHFYTEERDKKTGGLAPGSELVFQGGKDSWWTGDSQKAGSLAYW